MIHSAVSVLVDPPIEQSIPPLTVDEVIDLLRERWQASYDMQLVVRRKRMYLQVMWAYLEQQSFPLNEEEYRTHLAQVLDVVNRLRSSRRRAFVVNRHARPSPTRESPQPAAAGEGRLEEFLV